MTIETIKLEIQGMTCDDCVTTIEKKLEGLEGLKSKSVSYPEHFGLFSFDTEKTSKEEIIERINSTGHYKVVEEINNGKNGSGKSVNNESEQKTLLQNSDYNLIIIGGGSAGLTAAALARQLGVRIALLEKHPCPPERQADQHVLQL